MIGIAYYNLSYLELFPRVSGEKGHEVFPYICHSSKADVHGYGCLREEACKLTSPAYFDANPEAVDYLHNWASRDKLDLYCTDPGLIGLIGSIYFAG